MDEFIGQVDASRPGNPAPYWTNNPLKEIIPELMEGPGGKEKARHREAVPDLGNDRENQQTPEESSLFPAAAEQGGGTEQAQGHGAGGLGHCHEVHGVEEHPGAVRR